MSYHNPVLLSQSVDSLEIRDNGIYVDMTYGGGGHSREILKKLGSKGKLIAFDQDLDSQRNIIDDDRLFFFRQNNIFLMQTLEYLNVKKVDGILADLGVSSHQLDKKSRGFSFQPGYRLDMRMNQNDKITADEVLNQFEEEDIANILYKYSGEKNSRKIAKAISNSRPLKSTEDFSKVLKDVLGKQNPKYINQTIKRCFQAIRIYVNNELEEITLSINKIKNFIKPGGVIVCLTYHSLEDKIVKDIFNDITVRFVCNPRIPICNCDNIQEFRFGNNKKLYPSDYEIKNNSRSTSATLRYVVKIWNLEILCC